jgi:hypothetical protein
MATVTFVPITNHSCVLDQPHYLLDGLIWTLAKDRLCAEAAENTVFLLTPRRCHRSQLNE